MPHGKRYREVAKLVEIGKIYEPDEAMALLKETSQLKFDATAEAHIRLNVDPRHAEQMVRGMVTLPHGSGKVVRVAVFAQGDKAAEAAAAGADVVGADDLAERVEAGWLEFDVAVSTPDMMGRVGKLGRVLGRKGLMPNPKSGTVTFDLERVVAELKGGRIEFKVDKGGIIHSSFGRTGFEIDKLVDNLAALTDAINRARPKEVKGQYFKSLTVASTMGPGIRVAIPGLLARAA